MDRAMMLRILKTREKKKARDMAKIFGIRHAATYLKQRNWSLEATLWILLGIGARH